MRADGAAKILGRMLAYRQERLRVGACSEVGASHMCAEVEALKVALDALGCPQPAEDAPVRERQREVVSRIRVTCSCVRCPVHSKREAAE